MEGIKTLIPNSTQIPNVLLDLVFPRIPAAHERCLRYICRRTFGFGKKSDRIGLTQFVKGIKSKETGLQLDYGAGVAYGTAREALADLVEAQILTLDRAANGRANSYRVNLEIDPEAVLKVVTERVKDRSNLKSRKGCQQRLQLVDNRGEDTLLRAQHPAACATGYPAACAADYPAASSQHYKTKGNQEKVIPAAPAPGSEKTVDKPLTPFKKFTQFWHATVKAARRIEPRYQSQDWAQLRYVLDQGYADEDLLEKMALIFLADPQLKKFNPSMSVFFSGGILTGLMNRFANDAEIWKKFDQYVQLYVNPDAAAPERTRIEASDIIRRIAELKERLGGSTRVPERSFTRVHA